MTIDPLVSIPVVCSFGAVVVVLAVVRKRRGAAWPTVARTLAIGACVTFIAVDPALAGGGGEARRAAADVLFVVDTTASMGAIDFDERRPRIEGVRADILDLAEEFPGAHFSLIRFDSQARAELPWTTDVGALRTAISVMQPERSSLSRGSRLDLPVPTMGELLPRPRAGDDDAYTVVFYFSDGEERTDVFPDRPVFGEPPELDLDDQSDPVTTFAELEPIVSAGTVFGYGTAEGAPMVRLGDPQRRRGAEELTEAEMSPYVRDFDTDDAAISRYDEANLVAIAGELGLPYVHRTEPRGASALGSDLAGAAPMVSDGAREAPRRLYWIGALVLLPLLFAQFVSAIGELSTARAAFGPRRDAAKAATAPDDRGVTTTGHGLAGSPAAPPRRRRLAPLGGGR